MKHSYKLLLFLVAAIGVMAFAAFAPPDRLATAAPETIDAIDYAPAGDVGKAISFNYRKDTLTNAELDTMNVGNRDNSTWNTVTTPVNFLSLYTYDIKLLPASLSGTMSVKMVLDASNTKTGTSVDWLAIDSLTATTAKVLQLRSTDATAYRYRLRVIGSGTQSSTYTITTAWKKKN